MQDLLSQIVTGLTNQYDINYTMAWPMVATVRTGTIHIGALQRDNGEIFICKSFFGDDLQIPLGDPDFIDAINRFFVGVAAKRLSIYIEIAKIPELL